MSAAANLYVVQDGYLILTLSMIYMTHNTFMGDSQLFHGFDLRAISFKAERFLLSLITTSGNKNHIFKS